MCLYLTFLTGHFKETVLLESKVMKTLCPVVNFFFSIEKSLSNGDNLLSIQVLNRFGPFLQGSKH